MLKQTVFSYDTFSCARRLGAWPVDMEDLSRAIGPLAGQSALCAVEHETWGENVTPRASLVPGRLVGNGALRELSVAQLARFMLDHPEAGIVQDLMVFLPRRKLSGAECRHVQSQLRSRDVGVPRILKEFGGIWLYLHDEDSFTALSLLEAPLAQVYASLASSLAKEIEPCFVRRAWTWLKKNFDRSQVVCGYERTLYFRFEERDIVGFNDLGAALDWNVKSGCIMKEGPGVPGFMVPKCVRKS